MLRGEFCPEASKLSPVRHPLVDENGLLGRHVWGFCLSIIDVTSGGEILLIVLAILALIALLFSYFALSFISLAG